MGIKYRITEAQLMKIHERLNESTEDVPGNTEDPKNQPGFMSEEEDEDSVDESETTGKKQAPEAKNPSFMANKMQEEVGKEKFSGTKVAGTKTPGTWDKNVKSGKTPTDQIKSGGAAKKIEGTKAKTGEWDGVTKSSPEAKAHILKGLKAGDVKNSMGVKSTPTKDTADKGTTQSADAKKHISTSLKSGGSAKDIESAKAKTGNWEGAKTGSVNEKKSMSAKEMRDEKKRAMEERANRMDGLA
jgi:hypothetical protein